MGGGGTEDVILVQILLFSQFAFAVCDDETLNEFEKYFVGETPLFFLFLAFSSPKHEYFGEYTYLAGMTINVSINIFSPLTCSLISLFIKYVFFGFLFHTGFSKGQNRLLTRFCVRVFYTSVFNGDDISGPKKGHRKRDTLLNKRLNLDFFLYIPA